MSEQSMLIFNILGIFHNFEIQKYKKIGTANPGTSEKRPGDGRPGQTKNGRGSSRPFDGWTQRGMIPRPSDYESAALTD